MRLAIASTLFSLSLACEPDSYCPKGESFPVRIQGTCSDTPSEAQLSSSQCGVTLEAKAGVVLGLPARGALAQDPRPLREGGWQVYGNVCPSGQLCNSPFRRCVAVRAEYQLQVDCSDGNGAPVCSAIITE
jgi:hypothetical protein